MNHISDICLGSDTIVLRVLDEDIHVLILDVLLWWVWSLCYNLPFWHFQYLYWITFYIIWKISTVIDITFIKSCGNSADQHTRHNAQISSIKDNGLHVCYDTFEHPLCWHCNILIHLKLRNSFINFISVECWI